MTCGVCFVTGIAVGVVLPFAVAALFILYVVVRR